MPPLEAFKLGYASSGFAVFVVCVQSYKKDSPSSGLFRARVYTEGTHSILDIDRVSPEPTFGAIAPLPRERVLEIFGTEYPTRDMVEKWSARVDAFDAEPLFKRWGGIYIVVYRDTEAVEICFEGCSGD
jgi:hypothetical protein